MMCRSRLKIKVQKVFEGSAPESFSRTKHKKSDFFDQFCGAIFICTHKTDAKLICLKTFVVPGLNKQILDLAVSRKCLRR